ncbi:MAG: alpha/beta hydrolase [Albidovulum sp.]|uniref:alpha/beta fold hydrolase n=1 Tax=Albidovulum sp. TaxID=1872424 RepID=UPI003C93EA2F
MKIVVLPGLDGTGHLLGDFADALSDEHRVEVLSYPLDMTSYAEIAEWLARQRHDEEFAIVAESFSGPLAIDLAAAKPDGLRAVIFVATFACAPRHVPQPLIRLMKILPVPRLALAWLSLPFVMGGKGTAEFRANYQRALRKVPMSSMLSRLAAVLTVDKRDMLPKVTVPCIYLHAEKDRLVPLSAAADFAPICDAVISVDAPHFLLQTRPIEAAQHVAHFLSKRQQ